MRKWVKPCRCFNYYPRGLLHSLHQWINDCCTIVYNFGVVLILSGLISGVIRGDDVSATCPLTSMWNGNNSKGLIDQRLYSITIVWVYMYSEWVTNGTSSSAALNHRTIRCRLIGLEHHVFSERKLWIRSLKPYRSVQDMNSIFSPLHWSVSINLCQPVSTMVKSDANYL